LLSSCTTKIKANLMQDLKMGSAAKGEGIRGIRTWRASCCLRDVRQWRTVTEGAAGSDERRHRWRSAGGWQAEGHWRTAGGGRRRSWTRAGARHLPAIEGGWRSSCSIWILTGVGREEMEATGEGRRLGRNKKNLSHSYG
jgi:hypothetical protein